MADVVLHVYGRRRVRDAFKEAEHPRGEGGKFASEPGGKTEYRAQSSGLSNRPFQKKRAEAHAHAAYLRERGHEGVKVTRKIGNITLPGHGIGTFAHYSVH